MIKREIRWIVALNDVGDDAKGKKGEWQQPLDVAIADSAFLAKLL